MKLQTWLKKFGSALSWLPVLALSLGLAYAEHPKLANDLPDDTSMVDVIIQYKQPPTQADHRKVSEKGGQLKQSLESPNGAVYSVSAAEWKTWPKTENVAYISPDRSVQGTLEYANPTVYANIARRYGWDGTGVGVAVIDSGLQGRPDLNFKSGTSRVVYSQSFIAGLDATDFYGHGTHVAGIVAGNGYQSTGPNATRSFIGIAPNATIVALRVLDGNGNGTDSAMIGAINQAIPLKAKYNIRVINLSLGRPVYENYNKDPLCLAVEKAWQKGIVVVVAAGNEGRNNTFGTNGYGTITAPGNDPYVITVGAMKDASTASRADDSIASYVKRSHSGGPHR